MTETEWDLDPRDESQWSSFERAALSILQRVVQRSRSVRSEPCYRAMLEEHAAALREPPSAQGLGLEEAVRRALLWIEPYATGNASPRFWGWIMGGGNLAGMLGEWLAASMNANVFAGAQGPVQLERAILDWCRQWFELPAESSGILLEGASGANQLGIAIARHWRTEGRVKREGNGCAPGLRLYASRAAHNSIVKAAELLGLGSDAVHLVANHPDGTLDVAALEHAIDADLAAGLLPFCVVGSAGTVGLGAIDPLADLHMLCVRRDLWLHVDGANGALGFLSPVLRARLNGIERAHSIALDFHKWGQVPYDVGCLLVRDGSMHAATFGAEAGYLGTLNGGINPHGSHAFHCYTAGLSRGDRALKIWMTFQAYGVDRLCRVFERNVEHACYLAARLRRLPKYQVLHEPALSIVCFRHRLHADPWHERALIEMQTSGFAVLSPFYHEGALAFRVSLSNHRTRREDLDALVERLARFDEEGI